MQVTLYFYISWYLSLQTKYKLGYNYRGDNKFEFQILI